MPETGSISRPANRICRVCAASACPAFAARCAIPVLVCGRAQRDISGHPLGSAFYPARTIVTKQRYASRLQIFSRVPSVVPVRSPDLSDWRVSPLAGNVKQNLAPRGGLSRAHKRPPLDSTMERLICSPMPVPFVLVEKNVLKILTACCDGSPKRYR